MSLLRSPRSWFNLGRHDIRSTLPASIQGAFQPYLLEGIFEDALLPDFLFPGLATNVPVQANMGDTIRRTRRGLLTPVTTPITGSDASAATYGLEQWDAVMDQYGQSVDTNMLASLVAFASKYAEDLQVLGTNAGQSLNQIARNKLYAKYVGGRTWAPALG